MADPVKPETIANTPESAVTTAIGPIPIAQNAPGEEIKPKVEDKYQYTITDKVYGELNVKKSANAWWTDEIKVRNLIDAYKIDCTDEEARSYAGISEMQLRYFNEQHPDFYQVKAACKELIFLKARKLIADNMDTYDRAFQFMERKKKNEFAARTEHTGADGKNLIPLSEEQESKIQALAGIVTEQNDNQGPSTIPTNSDTPRA